MVFGEDFDTQGLSHSMETLGKHFKTLASAALQKHGFRQGDLLSHWSAIAGDELAAITSPERIKWPRNGLAEMGEAPARGATLVLRCNPGHGLDVQYQVPMLVERVNQFFGYRAISTIKVVQAGKIVTMKPRASPKPPSASASVQAQTDMIESDDLKNALRRLGAHVESRRMQLLTDR
jgi:hypothetical protein